MFMTVDFEGSAHWPHQRSIEDITYSSPVLRGLFESARFATEFSAPIPQDSRETWRSKIASLETSWPESVPRFTHPADWRPSIRNKQFTSITDSLLDVAPAMDFASNALEYHN